MVEFVAIWVIAWLLYFLLQIFFWVGDILASHLVFLASQSVGAAVVCSLAAILARYFLGRRSVGSEAVLALVFSGLPFVFLLGSINKNHLFMLPVVALVSVLIARLIKNLCPICRRYD